MNKGVTVWSVLFLVPILISCSGSGQFSLDGKEDVFNLNQKNQSKKIDILWVIDNSGSMATSQDNVANNFNSFIQGFLQTNFDFQIAVTTTEAWSTGFTGNPSESRFKDGTDATSHTGYFIINRDTPNIESVFQTNVLQGITGSGDERGLQSLTETLNNADNASEFPRSDAFLSVIFLTDEDDFSHDGSNSIQGDYSNPALHPVSTYVDYLDNLTGSTGTAKNYHVNTIGILDQVCLDQLNNTFTGRRIANRYIELSDATNGVKGSLCGDFSNILSNITDTILEYTTKFFLSSPPVPETLVVKINDQVIPQGEENGWTYDATENAITFHGSVIPSDGAVVTVAFERATAGG